jgi:enterochelin esterase-like enzyme
MIAQLEIADKLFAHPRKVWVQPAVSGQASDCCIFLDAELYMDRVRAPKTLDDLQTTNAMPPTTSIYLSNLDSAARHADFTCNEAFADFVAAELSRWIERTVLRHERLFLCGLSLSGLSAAFTALRHPTTFSGILCQSPSAWWNDEWLSRSLKQSDRCESRLWISVGNQEREMDLLHPPTGLHQKVSQLDSVRRLAQQLSGSCSEMRYTEFSGRHDPACWAAELPNALGWLTRPPTSAGANGSDCR